MNKIKFLVFTLTVGLISLVSCNSQNKSGKVKLTNETDSVSYSIGLNIAKIYQQDFESKGLDETLNYEMIVKGMSDLFNEKELQIQPEMAYGIITKFLKNQDENMRNASMQKAEKNLEEGLSFLAENKKKEGVTELESGLQYEVLVNSDGPKPSLTDKVTTHYHGTLIDGKVFDSSVERGEPVQFPVNGVIKGWTEALQLMSVGSKWRLYVPSNLAYGERGAGGDIGPNQVLIFDVELIAINE